MDNNKNKRRLNFISGEDFYFLAYSILLVLECLGGTARRIKDHRKITFLIQFMTDDRLLSILSRTITNGVANPVDRELLFNSFTTAELHKREVFKILFSLERRDLVEIQRTDVAEVLDVTLCKNRLPMKFFENANFEKERINAEKLKRIIPRISALNFDNLIERLYKDRGVQVWAT
ncbi:MULTISPECIES: hypothetical protein [unclassified Thiomonas]|uniref:hypothetical protein n=1 Tax=unclassified Thiomonas TaxID=2625466 RepID=UPI0012A944B3|nr:MULTISPECIES: hypothetical protein [unclassified Thiomonas]VDY07672.1 conserved protein of unknown function [Thiomonas sp. Sup16B3]